MINRRNFVKERVLKDEDWTTRCLSLAVSLTPVAHPHPCLILAPFYPAGPFHVWRLRSLPLSLLMMPRVCEVRLFGFRLSARALFRLRLSPVRYLTGFLRAAWSKSTTFMSWAARRDGDAKTDKRRNPCLAVVSRRCSASQRYECLTAPEQAHKKQNRLCVYSKDSSHTCVINDRNSENRVR